MLNKFKAEYYRQYRARKFGKPNYTQQDMEKCLICRVYFVFLGAHVYQKHQLLMEDYKNIFGLDKKRGRTKGQFRLLKAKTNKGIKNLRKGKQFRFVKGDKVAGRYVRSKETQRRLRKQSLQIGRGSGLILGLDKD